MVQSRPVNAVTQILDQIQRGDADAANKLLPLVYHELRRLASARVAHDQAGKAHDATSLVHEAYLRLVGDNEPARFANRAHFFAAAAEAMRRILVDNARRNRRPKHGGDRRRVELEVDCATSTGPDDNLLELNDALDRLAAEDPEKAAVVKLRYFAGLSIDECAAALDISPATAKRRWAYARAWLYDAMTDEGA